MNSVIAAVTCPKRTVNCCSSGLTTLMMCATADTVKLLLVVNGWQLLLATIVVTKQLRMHCSAMCILIKAGADLHAVNSAGNTAAQVAHDRGYALIERILNRAAAQQQEC
jgi:hypothetical protein